MNTCVIQSAYNGVETIVVSTVCTNIIKSSGLYRPLIPLHVGTVEFMQGVFKEIGIKVQELGYPDELTPFYNRDIVYNGFKKNRFIKPYDCKMFEVFIQTDTDVLGYGRVLSWWSQEIVTFLQEYRVYCVHDKIVGMGRYDDLDDPDLDETEIREFVEKVISAWKDRPSAYARSCQNISWKSLLRCRIRLMVFGMQYQRRCEQSNTHIRSMTFTGARLVTTF